MTYDDDTAIVLWPEYFDIGRTRAEGRRVPKEYCVKKPSLDIIAKGAMILNLEYKIDETKAYPGNMIAKQGCVRVERDVISKSELLLEIGKILVKNQA